MDIDPQTGSVTPAVSQAATESSSLCLVCGLCCNGVIFADVKIQPGDDAARLNELGLPLLKPKSNRLSLKWKQPCAAWEGCRCRIYHERPQYCREFECRLLKRVKAGQMNPSTALRIIHTAREQAAEVRHGLRALGENDEGTSLAVRFRRLARRLERDELDPQARDSFGQLTLTVHKLNLLLSETFYSA